MQVKRTYGSRSHSTPVLSKRKRALGEVLTNSLNDVARAVKRAKVSGTSKSKSGSSSLKSKSQQKSFTQLHLAIEQSTLRTCALCELSYTKGAPEDESLHRSHCARVRRGMEWGREEERESAKAGVVEVAREVKVGEGKRGRIIWCPGRCPGKIGNKISSLLQTINLNLSSPGLGQECLGSCKIYMFLLPQMSNRSGPCSSAGSGREKIVGCVVAQRISTAMAIASEEEVVGLKGGGDGVGNGEVGGELVEVDRGSGLFCHPDGLATPMGIPRLFVASTYRRQGIGSALLTAAAATFIHGCPLDGRKGQVAFTQPTGEGKALMTKWGGGGVRIYEE